MGLQQLNFEGKNKIEVAIMRLKEFEPSEEYFLAFSGGKDSVVIYDLAQKSGIKFKSFYNWTGIDPPELLKFAKENYPEVEIRYPKKSMWKLINEHCILPTRKARFCCEDLKERDNNNKSGRMITGIRWAESVARHRRKMVEVCTTNKLLVFLHPIIDWTDKEVWEYIKGNSLPYCKLYDEGFKRLGCLLCPFVRGRGLKMQMERYPKYVAMWKRACGRLFDKGYKPEGCQSADELFSWWLSRERYKREDDNCFARFI